MSNRQLPISPELKILIATRDAIQDGPEFWCTGHYVYSVLRSTPSGDVERIDRRCAVGHLLHQMELAKHELLSERSANIYDTQHIVNLFLREFNLTHDDVVGVNDGVHEDYTSSLGRQGIIDLLTSVIESAKQKLTVPV